MPRNVWQDCAVWAVLYLLLVGRALAKLRRFDVGDASAARNIEVSAAHLPPEAVAALRERRPTHPGMTSYGFLTVMGRPGQTTVGEVWLDATRTMIVQVMWSRSAKGRTANVATVASYVGAPAQFALIGVSSMVAGVTSGHRPGTSVLRLPGATTDELVLIQRRQLAASGEVALRFPDLASVRYMLDGGGLASREWATASGRLTRSEDGTTRLGLGQCLWWVLRSDWLVKPIYRWQVRLRGLWAIRRLPEVAAQ